MRYTFNVLVGPRQQLSRICAASGRREAMWCANSLAGKYKRKWDGLGYEHHAERKALLCLSVPLHTGGDMKPVHTRTPIPAEDTVAVKRRNIVARQCAALQVYSIYF